MLSLAKLRERLKSDVPASVALAALGLALLFVLVNQAHDTGFESGHRGWCSANVMAVIEQAVPSNGFVGYTLELRREDGAHDYAYFDRYPVFFSVGMHVLLNTFELSRGTQIYVARQAMNVLYGLTLIMALAMLVELQVPIPLAVAAVALAGSGKLIVTYRDMIHFDQAAMLGFMGLLWAIARWYRTRDDRFILIASVVAVLMGRGYASFAVLGVWWLVEAVRTAIAERKSPRALLRWLALGTQTRACVLAIAVAGSCLGYNIVVEAHKRDVPIAKVGIVQSALRRVMLDDKFAASKKATLAWPSFFKMQARRSIANVQPFIGPHIVPKDRRALTACYLLAALLIGLWVRSRPAEQRPPWIIASLAGYAWIVPMRGLTAFHEFTTMFTLSLCVVLMASLLRFVSLVHKRGEVVAALLACACLVYSTQQRNKQLNKYVASSAAVTEDFRRIEAQLKPGEPINLDPERKKLVKGVPYALGFLLPNQPIMNKGKAPYLIALSGMAKAKAEKRGTLLTPNNKNHFLYRLK